MELNSQIPDFDKTTNIFKQLKSGQIWLYYLLLFFHLFMGE